jgi:hypothetical protein
MVTPNPYSAIPPPPTGQVPSLANLPPNILALLQNAQAQQQQQQQQPPPPPPPQYGMPPPSMMSTAPPPMGSVPPLNANAQPGYQQLMAYLVSPEWGIDN